MLTYEIARELKDLGFPQKQPGKGELGWKYNDKNSLVSLFASTEGDLYIPSLSELIEACGDKFSHLEQMTFEDKDVVYDWVKEEGTWHAEYQIGISPQMCASGFTPEEAVTNLWLQINKK